MKSDKTDKIIDAIGNINESMVSAADTGGLTGAGTGRGAGARSSRASGEKRSWKTGAIAAVIAAVFAVAGISAGIILGYRAIHRVKDPTLNSPTDGPENTAVVTDAPQNTASPTETPAETPAGTPEPTQIPIESVTGDAAIAPLKYLWYEIDATGLHAPMTYSEFLGVIGTMDHEGRPLLKLLGDPAVLPDDQSGKYDLSCDVFVARFYRILNASGTELERNVAQFIVCKNINGSPEPRGIVLGDTPETVFAKLGLENLVENIWERGKRSFSAVADGTKLEMDINCGLFQQYYKDGLTVNVLIRMEEPAGDGKYHAKNASFTFTEEQGVLIEWSAMVTLDKEEYRSLPLNLSLPTPGPATATPAPTPTEVPATPAPTETPEDTVIAGGSMLLNDGDPVKIRITDRKYKEKWLYSTGEIARMKQLISGLTINSVTKRGVSGGIFSWDYAVRFYYADGSVCVYKTNGYSLWTVNDKIMCDTSDDISLFDFFDSFTDESGNYPDVELPVNDSPFVINATGETLRFERIDTVPKVLLNATAYSTGKTLDNTDGRITDFVRNLLEGKQLKPVATPRPDETNCEFWFDFVPEDGGNLYGYRLAYNFKSGSLRLTDLTEDKTLAAVPITDEELAELTAFLFGSVSLDLPAASAIRCIDIIGTWLDKEVNRVSLTDQAGIESLLNLFSSLKPIESETGTSSIDAYALYYFDIWGTDGTLWKVKTYGSVIGISLNSETQFNYYYIFLCDYKAFYSELEKVIPL